VHPEVLKVLLLLVLQQLLVLLEDLMALLLLVPQQLLEHLEVLRDL
jgi:hypothetical protein